MSRLLLIPLLLVSLTACRPATAPVTAPPGTVGTPPASARTVPEPDSIAWVRRAAEYRASVLQTYRMATTRVEAAATGRQAGTWAVILDADETVISNLEYQAERAREGLGFSPDSWYAWVRRREATPLPGAAAFLTRIRALGGRIAIVTNRRQAECADTIAVFERHALVHDAMLCRPDQGPSGKQPRFDAVARGQTAAGTTPLEVIAYVGDNIQDFPGLTQDVTTRGDGALADVGVRFFVIPNPMYGSWQ